MRQLEFPENIQAIVGGKEYSLDNTVLKIWPESEETKGALCVEMEGVGLFTIANYRKCVATGIYVVSDNGTRYEIVGKGDVINTIEPKNQGLQTIIIYRQNEDGTWNYSKGYLQIGSELD